MRLHFQAKGSAWSIVVMPYELRIDNYHRLVHVHPPRERGRPVPVRDTSMDEAREILERHLRTHQALLFPALLEELR